MVLGAIYPLSGPQASGGKSELAGVQAALRASDAGVRLEVIDATTPQAAAAAVDTLVRHYHVPAILGTYGSTLSAAASARAEELKTVYWETGAVADPITVHRHYVFRTVATGSALGRMAVTFSHDVLVPGSHLASPRAVIVRVDDIYGRSVDVVPRRAAQRGRFDLGGVDPRRGRQCRRAGWRQHQRRRREVRRPGSARRGSERAGGRGGRAVAGGRRHENRLPADLRELGFELLLDQRDVHP